MSKKHNRYTVTAALPYANGPLHIGHIAGAYFFNFRIAFLVASLTMGNYLYQLAMWE